MKKLKDSPSHTQEISLQETIFMKTTDFLYQGIPSAVFATIIIAALLSVVLWQFFDKTLLIIWFISISSINFCRLILYKIYSKNVRRVETTKLWDRLFYILLILNCLSLSAISIWFLPDNSSVYHYFPGIILIGISAGAVTSLSFSMRNIITYFVIVLSPLFFSEVLIGTFISYSVALLTMLLTVFSLLNAKRFNQRAIENITLQFNSEKHNQELIESEHIAQEANNAKSKFISLMSHELRTPLNAILGYAQLINMSDSPVLNEEQYEQTQGIIGAGTHLLSLIEELLDLSRIEANKINTEMAPVSVANVLEQSVSMLNYVANEEGIKLINNVENKYLISADEKRLKQVFINLISNAIKYNEENGSVTINAGLLENNRVRISVVDNGYGLTNEQQFELFKPFQRFDTRKEGIGLGLYIVYHLVDKMKGKIGVESEYKKGSTFWVEFTLIE